MNTQWLAKFYFLSSALALAISVTAVIFLGCTRNQIRKDSYVNGVLAQEAIQSAGDIIILSSLFKSIKADEFGEIQKLEVRGLLTSKLISTEQTFHYLKGGMKWDFSSNFNENNLKELGVNLGFAVETVRTHGIKWGLQPDDLILLDKIDGEIRETITK